MPDVGRRQVGRVADGAPVVGRQRGHRLCGDLSEGGDLELHPRRQALPQSVRACGMADVVPGRRTMRYGVEVSWALPL